MKKKTTSEVAFLFFSTGEKDTSPGTLLSRERGEEKKDGVPSRSYDEKEVIHNHDHIILLKSGFSAAAVVNAFLSSGLVLTLCL